MMTSGSLLISRVTLRGRWGVCSKALAAKLAGRLYDLSVGHASAAEKLLSCFPTTVYQRVIRFAAPNRSSKRAFMRLKPNAVLE